MARQRIIQENGYYAIQYFIGIGTMGWWHTSGYDTPFGYNPHKYYTLEDAEQAILSSGGNEVIVIKEYR